jgi:hypothetical protein
MKRLQDMAQLLPHITSHVDPDQHAHRLARVTSDSAVYEERMQRSRDQFFLQHGGEIRESLITIEAIDLR